MKIEVDSKERVIEGYSNGFNHPTSILKFIISDYNDNKAAVLVDKIYAAIRYYPDDDKKIQLNGLVKAFALLIYSVQKKLALPIFEVPKILFQEQNTFVLQIPCFVCSISSLEIVNSILIELNKVFVDSSLTPTFGGLIKNYSRKIKIGKNPPFFLAEAFKKKIPLIQITEQIYQYGISKNSIWLDSTFTNKTPVLSANIARNKINSSRLMRISGLPAPIHIKVSSIDDAISASKKIGYPLVVKPIDLDGGVGVFADLKNEAELRDSYQRSVKFSKNIIIEKHVVGKDYRLTVMGDKLLWTILREPPTIIGDGHKEIVQLISDLNNLEARGKKNGPILIKVDDEIIQILKENNLNEKSVLPKGYELALRKRANVATGAMPKSISCVHEDNKSLAIKAAKLHNLDLAGIDLIIPDISKSWKQVGGVICEVNAQPQLGSITSLHLFSEILDTLLPNGYAVPTICLVSKNSHIKTLVGLNGWSGEVGFANNSIVLSTIDENYQAFNNLYSNLRLHAVNKEITKIIFEVSNKEDAANGLPFKILDYLIIDFDSFENSQQLNQLIEILKFYMPRKILSLSKQNLPNLNVTGYLGSIEDIMDLN